MGTQVRVSPGSAMPGSLALGMSLAAPGPPASLCRRGIMNTSAIPWLRGFDTQIRRKHRVSPSGTPGYGLEILIMNSALIRLIPIMF